MKLPAVSTVHFGTAVKKLIDAKIPYYNLIPVMPPGATIAKGSKVEPAMRGKTPGRYFYHRDEWSGFGGDTISQGPTRELFDTWQKWPTSNIGILGRYVPAIDSDAETEVAAELVRKAITRTFGKDHGAAVRLRGNVPRRLFAFLAENGDDDKLVVRGRHIKYQPKGDKVASKIDIIGRGNMFVGHGRHPSGDDYGWDSKHSLLDPDFPIVRITNVDIDRFCAVFVELVEASGGEIIKASRGNSFDTAELNVSKLDPVMTLADVMQGLDQLPNDEANFPDLDDLVSVLAQARAALGRDANKPEVEAALREWATKGSFDEDWCDDAYFDKRWESLGRVRVSQDALERRFRRNGITHTAKNAFPDDAGEVVAKIEKTKEVTKAASKNLLGAVAARYVFCDANRLRKIETAGVRDRNEPKREIAAIKWWKQQDVMSDGPLLTRLQQEDRYPNTEVGLANFLRDLNAQHPDCFFIAEIKDPYNEPGDIVTERIGGSIERYVNVRPISEVIIAARKAPKNMVQDKKDVETVLYLIEQIFLEHADYELDTLAYMAQKPKRPGNMLFLYGDAAVGKTSYIKMLIGIFDGKAAKGVGMINGAQLVSESTRRFIYSNAEGCRILSHNELPTKIDGKTRAAIESQFKVMVDAGSGGDWLYVEAKGVDIRPIRNVCRVIVSSNYADSIEIAEQERRIFYVESGITKNNLLGDYWYKEIGDITDNPDRLAAFYRYLLKRDISEYNPNKAPPTTSAKLGRQIRACDSPARRHLMAAVCQLEASDRKMVTSDELMTIMSKMSKNERLNSGGHFDDETDYGKAVFGSAGMKALALAMRNLERGKLTKSEKEVRVNGRDRLTIYLLKYGIVRGAATEIRNSQTSEIMALIREDQGAPLARHPIPEYRDEDD